MAKAKHINIHGQNIFVNIIGIGEPIVFLHGGPGSEHRFFLPYVLPLSKTFSLVLYDQRGCGRSEPLPDGKYSIEEEVQTLEALRMELQLDKMNLFGESWGSMLALSYATTYPNRVDKLFLTAAIGIDNRGFKKFKKEFMKRISLKDKIKLVSIDNKVKRGSATLDDMLTILDPYYVYSRSSLDKDGKTSMNHTVNQIIVNDIEQHYDLSDKISSLENTPMLVAQGTHDILSPAMIRELLIQYIPHAELHAINNCGHWTVVEKAEEINLLVEQFFSNKLSPVQ